MHSNVYINDCQRAFSIFDVLYCKYNARHPSKYSNLISILFGKHSPPITIFQGKYQRLSLTEILRSSHLQEGEIHIGGALAEA